MVTGDLLKSQYRDPFSISIFIRLDFSVGKPVSSVLRKILIKEKLIKKSTMQAGISNGFEIYSMYINT
jgi:hypothetical protein